MAKTSISGETLDRFCPYFTDGGLISSGFIKDAHITSGKLADDAVTTDKVTDDNVTVVKLHHEVLTGVASAGTPVSAAHTLGVTPTLVIPTCITSGGSIATTGTHTSAAIKGIVSDISGGASFIIYIFE